MTEAIACRAEVVDDRHGSENQSLGRVTKLVPGKDHGVLITKEGGLLYFHRNALLSGDFGKLRIGEEVHYIEDIGDTGAIATKVRVKAKE